MKKLKLYYEYKADQKCIDALVKCEGVRLKIYNDHHPNEKVTKYDKEERPTIGYGHFIKKEEWEKYKNGITKEEAIKLKQKDIKKNIDAMKTYLKKDIKLTQSELML